MRLVLGVAVAVVLSVTAASAQPSVRYATYLGGAGNDGPASVSAVFGGTVLTAFEEDTNQPGNSSIRIIKFAQDTGAVVYSIAIGGAGRDTPTGIVGESGGFVWVAGQTTSTDFPQLSPIDGQTPNGTSPTAFLLRLSPTGALTFSTYFAPDLTTGTGSAATAISGSGGGVVVAGWTCGASIPTGMGAFQSQPAGGCDAFVATFSLIQSGRGAPLGPLRGATYLGGSGFDIVKAVVVGGTGQFYVGGGTDSADFPTTPGAFQATPGRRDCGSSATPRRCRDGFVGSLSGDLRQRFYATYLRETDPANNLPDSDEEVEAVADGGGTIYATGYTHSGNLFPTTPGAYRTTCTICGANPSNTGQAVGDMFVTRVNGLGTGLIFSTFLGGAAPSSTAGQVGLAIAVNGFTPSGPGPVFVAGYTTTSDFPIVDGGGGGDGFVARLNGAGSVLDYSTRFRGVVDNIHFDGSRFSGLAGANTYGMLWIAGTAGAGLPTTPDALQPQPGGGSDGFLAAIAWPVTVTTAYDGPVPAHSYSPVTIAGWSIENAATTDSGIDAVHIYAYPNPGSGAPPIFLGVATIGLSRPDVANAFGPWFANAGWSLTVESLPPANYTIAVFVHSRVTQRFTLSLTFVRLLPDPRLALDSPAAGAVVPFGTRVFVGGWAVDLSSGTGTGIDAIHVWIYPNGGAGTPFFAGVANYGVNRPDAASYFGGGRFTPCGYELDVNGLARGTYLIAVFAHSTFTDSFVAMQTRLVTIQ